MSTQLHYVIGSWKPTKSGSATAKNNQVFLPSSIVLSTATELSGPSPWDVKANTWNSYSVYLSRPLITPEKVVPPLLVSTCIDPINPFFL